MRGQMSIPTLLILFIAFLLLILLTPAMDEAIENTATILLADPHQYTTLTITLMRLTPSGLLLGLLATIFIYAIPNREGR